VLSDPQLRSSIETTAYRFGRAMTWPRVARGYQHTFAAAMDRKAIALGRSASLELAASKLWNDALARRAASIGESVSSH